MSRTEHIAIRHIPALDGLRGAAVAGVLVFHGGELSGGFMGVDLFFVLSGFLITTLLLREWDERQGIGLRQFWFRRARRLLPALFALVVGVALYAWFVASPYELDGIRTDGLAAIFYVANWHQIYAGSGYWDLFVAPSPFLHTWSLAIEEQFYLVWPLVVLGLLTLGRRRGRDGRVFVLVAAMAGALVSATVMALLWTEGTDPSRVYLGTDTRAAGVLVGAAAATVLVVRGPARTERGRLVLEAAGWVATVGLAVVWFAASGSSPFLYRYGFLACGIAAAVVIAAAAHPRPGGLSRLFSVRPLCWLGLISYGLYLWHWPVFIALRRQYSLDGWGLLAVGAPISIALSVASYHLLEQPIRRRGLAAFRRPGLAPVAAMASVAVLLLATMGGTQRPTVAVELANADPAEAAESFDTLPDFRPDRGTTPGTGPEGDETTDTTGATTTTAAPTTIPPTTVTIPVASTDSVPRPLGRPARVLIVGDSVAGELAKTMMQMEAELAVLIADRALYACPLGRGVWRFQGDDGVISERPACAQYEALWAEAVDVFRPDVVIVMFGGAPLAARELDGVFRDHCDPALLGWYVEEVRHAVDLLSAHGATVFVATPAPPTWPFFDQRLMNERTACMVGAYEDALAARPAARLLRIDQWVCPPPSGTCRDTIDGVKIRVDGIHYENDGAVLAARWIVTTIFA